MRSRNWCFTINNPISYPPDFSQWSEKIKILVCQLEMGEEETPHIQGYLEMKNALTMKALKKHMPTAHLEARIGTKKQAIEYCVKDSTRTGPPFTIGISGSLNEYIASLKSTTGTTSKERLQAIGKGLKEKSLTIEEICINDFDLWCRHFRAFEKYMTIITPPRNHEVETTVYYGPTGTGKSRRALELYPEAYWKQRSIWWDGYNGQETVILDEYYGWLPFDLLLRLCDRYPLLVETKGGQVQFLAKRIIFTSNTLPRQWYKNDKIYFESFERRVKEWVYFGPMGMWGFSQYENMAKASSTPPIQ